MTDSVYSTTLAGNLRIQNHKVLQTFLDVLLRARQTSLLLLDLLLNLLALFLQGLHGGRLFDRLVGFTCSTILIGFTRLFRYHSLLGRRLTTLLCLWSKGKTQKE